MDDLTKANCTSLTNYGHHQSHKFVQYDFYFQIGNSNDILIERTTVVHKSYKVMQFMDAIICFFRWKYLQVLKWWRKLVRNLSFSCWQRRTEIVQCCILRYAQSIFASIHAFSILGHIVKLTVRQSKLHSQWYGIGDWGWENTNANSECQHIYINQNMLMT